MNRHALTAEQLIPGYEDGVRPFAHPLDLALGAGTLVALLGANGAGKSTLLRTLSGLQKPLGGAVWHHPADGPPVRLDMQPSAARARVCSVVLTERADAELRVYDLVALGRFPYRSWTGGLSAHDHAHIARALTLTETAALAARPLYRLSDGERQRVYIARAIAQDAPIMLLDEPSAFLDYPHRVGLMRLLRDLAWEQGTAVLVSTHDLETALRFADRAWLLHDGAIADDVPEALALDGALHRAFGLGGPDDAAADIPVLGEGERAHAARAVLARVRKRVRPGVARVEAGRAGWRVVFRDGVAHTAATLGALVARVTDGPDSEVDR
jgi:iron complex transport system ATP-binding protein